MLEFDMRTGVPTHDDPSGVVRALHESGWALGRDYDAVTASFDPADTAERAAEQRRAHLQALGSRDTATCCRSLGATPA